MKTSSRRALEQSEGSTKAKPERTRKKARSESRIQLDRYNNLFECAFTKPSQNRPDRRLRRPQLPCARAIRGGDPVSITCRKGLSMPADAIIRSQKNQFGVTQSADIICSVTKSPRFTLIDAKRSSCRTLPPTMGTTRISVSLSPPLGNSSIHEFRLSR